MNNPYSNLFKDRSDRMAEIGEEEILRYVRSSNYLDVQGKPILDTTLPQDWQGYRPDSYFNFDEEGFDRSPDGNYTRWRAFRYYPFLGTFWPTNGSTDDVMIRLDAPFAQNENGQFDLDIYRLNLAIVEAAVKQKDIPLEYPVDEKRYEVDLNQNGNFDTTRTIVFAPAGQMSYVGGAKQLLENGQVHLAPSLFPEGTEFLHSVRYIDWNDQTNTPRLSARFKELRYARKYRWKTYSELQRNALAELHEAEINDFSQGQLASFRGNFERGMNNEMGWLYQGFIEDAKGQLRPQTQEETLFCMGCHSHLGATTDSTFAFARKFEGIDKNQPLYGWGHWSQKGLKNAPDSLVVYLNKGPRHEYSEYLVNNHSGNEFRNNEEVIERFFDAEGNIREDKIAALQNDVSLLLYPSRERALMLNKGYKAMVDEQSFIFGRDANITPMQHVLRSVAEGEQTGIETVIVPVY